jgi:hypothetical protein
MSGIDLSEFEALSKPKRPPCAVGVALSTLEKAEAAKLMAACDRPMSTITNAAIQKWLKARGHETTVQLVTSHRKATCSCGDG